MWGKIWPLGSSNLHSQAYYLSNNLHFYFHQIIKNDVEDSASGELLLDDDSSASGSGNEDATPVTPLPLQTVTTTESKYLLAKPSKTA